MLLSLCCFGVLKGEGQARVNQRMGNRRKYVECPKLNHVPTVTGFWPAARRRRVIKSIA